MWTFNVKMGWLDKDGILVDKNVYSGHGEGVNNSKFEAIPNVGPIPQGLWKISGPPQDMISLGPYVLALSPQDGTETFGRSGFFIHGDEIQSAGQRLASHGCIVASRVTRTRIYQSGDTDLTVISGEDAYES